MMSAANPALTSSTDAPVFDTARLYRDYAAAVARWASKLTRSSSEAEDVVQEVFLVAHRRLPELPPLRNPAPWLFRITTNVVRHRWRDQKRRMVNQRVPMPETAATGPSPLEILERNRQIDRLEQAMSTLHAEDRRLLWLCDVRCLPTSRVTAMTGIKPETLRVRRFRARAQIARQVREQTGEGARTPTGDLARDGAQTPARVRRARRPSTAHRP
jgi:RNA polymerase sigma-70 factor (ECF subfamily)